MTMKPDGKEAHIQSLLSRLDQAVDGNRWHSVPGLCPKILELDGMQPEAIALLKDAERRVRAEGSGATDRVCA